VTKKSQNLNLNAMLKLEMVGRFPLVEKVLFYVCYRSMEEF